MRLILLVWVLFYSNYSFSQTDCEKAITGVVLDIETHEPLPFATVQVVGSDIGAVADATGNFILKGICKNEVDLEAHFLGYKTVIHHHDFYHPDHVDNNHMFYLAPDETILESVVVEETRDGEMKTLSIQKKTVNKLSLISTSMSELTDDLSGVSLLKMGANISKPMIHGLHSNRVLVVNDGIRHAYQVWGQEHAPEIDPSHVDRIEIVKGAGTVKYGPEALGGVILYNSKKPTLNQSLRGSAGTNYQTNGGAFSSQVNVGQGSNRFAWNAGAFGVYQGDLEAPDYTLSNTGKREYGASFHTFLHRPKFDLQISGSYFDQQLGILRGSIVGNLDDLQNAINGATPNPTFPSTYDIQNPRQETQHMLLKSDLSFFQGDHIFNLQYAIQRNSREEFDVRRGELNDRPVIDLTLYAHTLEGEWVQPVNGRWSGSSGVQLFTQHSSNRPGSNPVNFVPDYDVLNVGAYTVQSINFDQTTLELGVRFDFQTLQVADVIRETFSYANDLSYANGTFTIGATKQINENTTLFSNIGSAWRPPNVAEIYSFGYHQSRIQFGLWRYNFDLSNPTPPDSVFDQSLRSIPAEQGFKWISGVEVRKKNIAAEFILYANQINNYLFLRPYGITTGIAGTFPFFIYDQTDALFVGSDWDIQWDHSPLFTSEIKVSYVYATSLERRQPLLEVPPFNLNYLLNYRKGHWDYGLTLDYTATQWNAPVAISPEAISSGKTEIDPASALFDFMSPPDGYLLMGANITYRKDPWTAALGVDNLLNSSYRIYTDQLRYFAEAPGRNFSLSVEYQF